MRGLLAFCLLSVSLVAGAAAPVQPAFADAITDAQNKANQAKAARDANLAKIAQDEAVIAQAKAQLAILGLEIVARQAEVSQEKGKLDSIIGQIDQAQRNLTAKKVEEAQRQDLLNKRMRVLYKQNGNTNFLDAMFSARTFSELVDRFMVMRDITHSDEVLLQQIQADKAAIEALTADLGRQRDAHTVLVKKIQGDSDALNAKYVVQRNLQLLAAADKPTQEQQAQANQAAFDRSNAEVAALQAAKARAHSSGIFAWPGVQGPITQRFGCTDFGREPAPPPGYTCHPLGTCISQAGCFHTGIDIAGPYGAEIDSADGGIAYTYPGNTGYGNHVIVVHANGFVTLYGHLSGFAVSDAQGVAKGQKIGYEGSTGFSSGPHLHFEIRLNNQPVNPCQYVGC